jgi:hypothetical protein
MVFPLVLQSLPGSNWSHVDYNWVRSDGIYEIYKGPSGDPHQDEIAVNTETNVWQDWNTDQPNDWPKYVIESVVDGVMQVNLSNDSFPSLFRFIKPTVASWITPPNTNSNSDPPENDPPPTPVFVPRSTRRGNLNFW